MMTGLAGAAMWLMMGLMLLGLAVGAITWTRRRLHGRHDDQPPPTDQTPSNSCSGARGPRRSTATNTSAATETVASADGSARNSLPVVALHAALAGRSADRLTRDFSFRCSPEGRVHDPPGAAAAGR